MDLSRIVLGLYISALFGRGLEKFVDESMGHLSSELGLRLFQSLNKLPDQVACLGLHFQDVVI